MLKLTPVLKNYLWGGRKLHALYGRENGGDRISESWEVSVHPDGVSVPLDAYLFEHPEAIGGDGTDTSFPILIKYIDAKENLSVQVHPDDVYAQQVEGDNGKTEMWYIVEADENAGIYCGFRRDVDKAEFLLKVQDGTVEELLNFIPVKKGDCYLIEAGTVHAIGAGCVICEIQQSSNVTYRVYDYNRRDASGNLRQLHIDKAVDVINFSGFVDNTNTQPALQTENYNLQTLTQCKYFRCKRLTLRGEFQSNSTESFLAVNVLNGSGEINGMPFSAGDSFFLPAGEMLSVVGAGDLMLTDRPEMKIGHTN